MITQNTKKNSGFVILFAVTLSAILLSIALGVSNIAVKELKFSTSAKETSKAFFAADTGIEAVLFADLKGGLYPAPIGGEVGSWDPIIISSLGGEIPATGCAIITIQKDYSNFPDPMVTTIVSKGYNLGGDTALCESTNPNRIEREIKVSY